MSGYVDAAGVQRVGTVEGLPTPSVRCYARGLRHPWGESGYRRVTGWGPIDAREAVLTCTCCDRRKREVVDADSGEVLTADYTGGVWLAPGCSFPAAAARVELIRRLSEESAGATPVRARRRRKAGGA
jgi:hypothetical protein